MEIKHDGRVSYDGRGFLVAARGYLEWVRAQREGVTEWAAQMKRYPGMRPQCGLMLDAEGGVWEERGGVWVELQRGGLGEQYKATGRRLVAASEYRPGMEPFEVAPGVTFVAEGWRRRGEAWTMVPAREGESEYECAVRRLAHVEEGLKLGEALVGLTAEAIDAWAQERAGGASFDARGLRSMGHVDGDWASLTRAFGLPSAENVPDHGEMLCLAHLLVDRAAGLTGTGYAH
jgi:hypothetical protein